MKPKTKRKLCAVIASFIVTTFFISACTPDKPNETPTPDVGVTYSELVDTMENDFSHLDVSNINLEELKIISVNSSNGQTTIESYAPVEDSDYEYCVFTSTSNKVCKTLEEVKKDYSNNLYNTTNYLVDESYYTLDQEKQDIINFVVDSESLMNSSFFETKGMETYVSKITGNEIHMFNTDTQDYIHLELSKPFINFEESWSDFVFGEYKKYTREDLNNLGYIFISKDLTKDPEIKR